MKTYLCLLAAAFALSGCASSTQKNARAFLTKIAAMDITAADISQSTNTPVYSHSESVSGLHHAPGEFTVENLKATFSIPLWGTTWNFSASSIKGVTAEAVSKVAQAASPSATTPN
jgi:hypothetical protein